MTNLSCRVFDQQDDEEQNNGDEDDAQEDSEPARKVKSLLAERQRLLADDEVDERLKYVDQTLCFMNGYVVQLVQ